ncbi:hypothetical protein GCM10027299_16670 [Larkinella ripae]
MGLNLLKFFHILLFFIENPLVLLAIILFCPETNHTNMTLQEFTEEIRRRVGTDSGLNATVKLATDQGVIYIDGRQSPTVVSNEDAEADSTIRVSLSDLQKLGTGELNPMTAFMFGKLKVQGDMGLAMKIGQKLG